MASYNISERSSIPGIREFGAHLLPTEKEYIIIGNFNFEDMYADDLILGPDQLALKESGLSNDTFFEVMWDFATRRGEQAVMSEGESFIMTGDEDTLRLLKLECGERFCYLPGDKQEVNDFCEHEREVMMATTGINTNSPVSEVITGHPRSHLDS